MLITLTLPYPRGVGRCDVSDLSQVYCATQNHADLLVNHHASALMLIRSSQRINCLSMVSDPHFPYMPVHPSPLSSRLKQGKKNVSGVPYHPVTLQYNDGDDGRRMVSARACMHYVGQGRLRTTCGVLGCQLTPSSTHP